MASAPRLRVALLAAALAAFQGCACDSVPDTAIEECSAAHVLPATVATDILFVIDDSGSMSEEQDTVAANLLTFVRALAQSPVQNDWQIGITTTSVMAFNGGTAFTGGPMATDPFPAGALVKLASATRGDLVYDPVAYPATHGWGDASRLLVKTPALTDQDVVDYAQNFRVGTDGSGKEQPFRAARLALTDRVADGTNAGFLRDGARLAVIFVTDEDDCSDSADPFAAVSDCRDEAFKASGLDSVADFAAFLLGPVGGELRDVVVGAVFWPPGAACPAPYVALDDGDRFVALVDALGAARARTGNVCTDFSGALTGFAEVIVPSSVPLDGVPADHRMLVVGVTRDGAGTIPCTVALEGSAEQAAADAVYAAPRLGRPATLTFQNACRLELGDRIDVQVVCAG